MDVRRQVLQAARAHQLLLHPSSMPVLVDFAEGEGGGDAAQRQAALGRLFAAVGERRLLDAAVSHQRDAASGGGALQSRQVTSDEVRRAVDHLRGAARGAHHGSSGGGGGASATGSINLRLVVPSDIPRLALDEGRLQMGAVQEKASRIVALRHRFALLHAQCVRSGHFSRLHSAAAADPNDLRLPLVALSTLEGLPREREVVVLGIVTRQVHSTAVAMMTAAAAAASVEGEEAGDRAFTIEDTRATVPLVLLPSAAAASKGYFPTGGFYLAKGCFNGHAFVANSIAQPITESREAALVSVNGIDLFGLAPPDHERALALQAASLAAVMVVLSNVHLDDPKTMAHLETFFTAFEARTDLDLGDIAIVLVGSFISHPINIGELSHLDDQRSGRQEYRALFDRLGSLLHTKSPRVAAQCTFVLVPGPHDPTGPPNVVPQPRVAAPFTERLRRWCPRALFAPNPCRLRFYTHEIVVTRQDYQRHLRHAVDGEVVVPADPMTPAFEHVARTILGQCHLMPGSATGGGVMWPNDVHLRLYPPPQTLILCDRGPPFDISAAAMNGTRVVGPGSFSSEATFLWLTPADYSCALNSLL